MKRLLLTLAMIALTATVSIAAEKPLDADTQHDVNRHRAISEAHEAAAKCLESGKKDDVCEKELLLACKGLAIGRFCGMKHEH